MHSVSDVTSSAESVTALINYAGEPAGRGLVPTLPSLGQVNLQLRTYQVEIHSARPIVDDLDLDKQGFRLVNQHSEVAGSRDRDLLDRVYHEEMCALLKEVTGARDVFPERRGLVLRVAAESPGDGARPAGWAHMDYSEKTARDFRDLYFGPEEHPMAPYRRWGVFQTWRVTSPPPQDTLLAVTDGRTIAEGSWQIFDTMRGPAELPGNVFESRLGEADAAHRWYYFPNMTPDEVIVFKGYDSQESTRRHVLHTAFKVPLAEGVTPVPRTSIEGRYFAFFE